jgi:hypothetical protein
MIKQLLILVSIAFTFQNYSYGQNATDYFPASIGYKWFYKTTPFDSLNRPVDSLSFVSIDSFATVKNYKNKTTRIVVGKSGTPDIVPNTPYFDTSFVSLDSANIWNYMGSVPGIDTLSIGFLNAINDWYSVYRLSQALNSSYTVFIRDTVVSYNGLNTTFTTQVSGKRITDQNTSTPIGDFLCKKFIISYAIKAKVLIISIPLLTINDTVYIAPDNYIVRDVRPSSKVDLTYFGQIAFYIPGSRKDILAPPAVLNVSNEIIPNEFSLSQNYPNPFNPNTVISYSLSSFSNVKLNVYNMLGQKVSVIEDGYKNAGNYSVNFNAAAFPSGIYFYKLEAGPFSQVRKMLLIK